MQARGLERAWLVTDPDLCATWTSLLVDPSEEGDGSWPGPLHRHQMHVTLISEEGMHGIHSLQVTPQNMCWGRGSQSPKSHAM